jgi:serine/threonine-protein kinase
VRFVKWLLYACLFGAGVALGAYLLVRLSFVGTKTAVPMVVGLTREQAEWQAGRARLKFLVKTERYDLKAPKGLVVEQAPTPGMSTRRGMTLSVVVSKGVERLEVPALLGLRLDQAQLQLQQTGLRLFRTSYVHGAAPSPTVVAQDPPPGAIAPRDSDVSLLVSLGPDSPVFVTPHLVGLPYGTIQYQIQAYGVQVAAPRLARSPGAPPGAILAQSPGPGAPLRRSDLVLLTVSEP